MKLIYYICFYYKKSILLLATCDFATFIGGGLFSYCGWVVLYGEGSKGGNHASVLQSYKD